MLVFNSPATNELSLLSDLMNEFAEPLLILHFTVNMILSNLLRAIDVAIYVFNLSTNNELSIILLE